MKNVQTFDQFVNESYNVDEKSSGDNALLQKMYKALKNSKSFKSIKMEKPYAPEDWDGAVIKIVSKLKGTSQYHKDEVDEFEIGIEKDGGLTLHYVPSGNTEPVKSVVDVVKMTRANESVNESVNEAKNIKFPSWFKSFHTKLADRFDVEERDLRFEMVDPHLMGVSVMDFSQEGLDNFPKDARAILRTPEFKGKATFTFDGTGKIEDRLVKKHPEFEDYFDDDEHYWIYIK